MEISELEVFPERINVTKVITYDVEGVRQQIISDNRAKDEEIEVTLEDVIEMIYHYAEDDFGCGWGHKDDLKDLIFQDENGEEY
jgi:hypothetical protein